MKPFSRSQRVAGQIQKALSDLLLKGIRDPRLAYVTITGVKMARDLKTAYVYFSTYQGESKSQDVEDGFNSAKGFTKRHLAAQLGLRYMPEIKYIYDTSFDYGMKIEKLLQTLDVEDETAHSAIKK